MAKPNCPLEYRMVLPKGNFSSLVILEHPPY
jgi:hypothetical protein